MWNVLRKTANITLDIPNWVLAIDEHLLAPIHQAMRAVSPWQWLRKTVTANTTDRWCGYVNCRISWKSQRSCWFVMRYCMCAHLVSAKKEIKYLECLSATQQHSSFISHVFAALSLHAQYSPVTDSARQWHFVLDRKVASAEISRNFCSSIFTTLHNIMHNELGTGIRQKWVRSYQSTWSIE